MPDITSLIENPFNFFDRPIPSHLLLRFDENRAQCHIRIIELEFMFEFKIEYGDCGYREASPVSFAILCFFKCDFDVAACIILAMDKGESV